MKLVDLLDIVNLNSYKNVWQKKKKRIHTKMSERRRSVWRHYFTRCVVTQKSKHLR